MRQRIKGKTIVSPLTSCRKIEALEETIEMKQRNEDREYLELELALFIKFIKEQLLPQCTIHIYTS